MNTNYYHDNNWDINDIEFDYRLKKIIVTSKFIFYFQEKFTSISNIKVLHFTYSHFEIHVIEQKKTLLWSLNSTCETLRAKFETLWLWLVIKDMTKKWIVYVHNLKMACGRYFYANFRYNMQNQRENFTVWKMKYMQTWNYNQWRMKFFYTNILNLRHL